MASRVSKQDAIVSIGGWKEDARDALLLSPPFFHFHPVFGKNGQNNRLALPPLELQFWEIIDPSVVTGIAFDDKRRNFSWKEVRGDLSTRYLISLFTHWQIRLSSGPLPGHFPRIYYDCCSYYDVGWFCCWYDFDLRFSFATRRIFMSSSQWSIVCTLSFQNPFTRFRYLFKQLS